LDLRHQIHVNLAVMAVLSATLVGLGQRNVLLPVGMALAAAVSLWWCDRLGRIALDGWVINVTVVGTAAVAAWRFAKVGGPTDAAVAADGLIGLQAVMLFERKTTRTYWDLFSLSLLQAFLACAFYQEPLFGVVLAVYLFFVLSALALLGMLRQQQRCAQLGITSISPTAYDAGLRTDWWQVAGVAASTLIVGPLSLYLRLHAFSERGDARPAGPTADSSAHPKPPGAVGGLQDPVLLPAAAPPSPDGLGGEFWWRIGRLTLVSLVIGTGVFIATPRFGRMNISWTRGGGGSWRSAPAALQRTVGYDDQVQLGELGTTLDDTRKVLAVQFRRQRDDAPYHVHGNLFLRGAVLNRYTEGGWQYVPDTQDYPLSVLERPHWQFDREEVPGEVIRQEFRLDPLGRPELFCVWPSVCINRDGRLQFDPATQRFQQAGGVPSRRPFHYTLATAELLDGQQADLAPALAPVQLRPLLAWSSESLPSLAALAEQWMDQADAPVNDPIGRARALERALRSSPRFSYRLGEQQRDQALDPIEDFIVNDPRGHCEYFASALALMLRSQGLPSRVVIGFKTDEYNQVEQRYWVRQSHAHAWVETYIPPESIPETVRDRHPLFDWSHGGWLRLDPTPSSLSELPLTEYLKQKWRDWRAAVATVWMQHVMQMSGNQQDSLIYRPLLATLRETAARLRGVGSRNGDRTDEFSGSPWQVLLLTLPWIVGGTLALAVLAWWTFGRRRSAAAIRKRAGSSQHRWSGNGRAAANVEFYRRWEALWQQWGLDRPACQTPREFARQHGSRLAALAGQPQLRDAANCVVDAFYQVRFGGATLDERQTAQVEDALDRLRQATRETALNRRFLDAPPP
jgi:transglutaminase-like putative cysteine protease